jgi:hypothetical protein
MFPSNRFQPPEHLAQSTQAISARERLTTIIREKSLDRNRISDLQTETFRHLLRTSNYIRDPNFSVISDQDLGSLFYFIDECFFEGAVSSLCEKISSRPLRFRLSTLMTSTGGTTTMYQPRGHSSGKYFEITVATTPLFETFKLQNQTLVGGLPCQNRLEALQRIMEHEMLHLIEMLLWENSSCTRRPFRQLAYRFFRHSESNHRMLSPREVAFRRKGLKPGDAVRFLTGQLLVEGIVERIGKRATVLVEAAQGRGYSDGKRHLKYYVPLNSLQPTKADKASEPQ